MVVASSKVRTRGQITLPKEILKQLRAKEGEELTWIQIADGVVMLSRGSMSRGEISQRLLARLVVDVGQAAEQKGIRREEDLDVITKGYRKRSFENRYG